MAALIDTNILVYRFDDRFPDKQRIATTTLKEGIAADSGRIPHQALVEFVAATTRNIRGHVILKPSDALREVEAFLKQFVVLYPSEGMVLKALRGCTTHRLSWFDAHMWAYAEHYGLTEILTEDFQHGRIYGGVRAINAFV